MMKRFTHFNSTACYIALLLAALTIFPARAQLVVTSGGAATAIAQTIVGPGITITNATMNCNVNAYGTFTANATNLGISSGILLTTGSATNAIGPNSIGSSSTAWNTTFSDANLIALQPGANRDVCVLEFDVVPQCSTLSIHYVFGSEEYPEWVSSTFNDAFGFFLSGVNPLGGNYNNLNIATLPNGQYVSIDNVNAAANNAFYVNNAGGTTIQYDGFTVPLVAAANVVPCSTYHLKIIIADAGDWSYDSGVFFTAGGLNCPQSQILAVNISTSPSSCTANTGTATAVISGGIGPFTYTWSTGQIGVTSISNLGPGNYSLTVNDLNACTQAFVQNFTIPGPSSVTATSSVTNVSCNGGNNGSITLTAQTGPPPFTYSLNGSPFNSNNNFMNLTAGTYAAAVQAGNGCIANFNVTVSEPPTVTATPVTLANVSCNGGSNGSVSVTPGGGTGAYTYSWWTNGSSGQSLANLPAGGYTVTVTDAAVPGCAATTTVNVSQPQPLGAVAQIVNNVSCNGGANGSATVNPSGGSGNYTYSWLTTPAQTTQMATGLSATTYTVFVSDAADPSCTTSTSVSPTQPAPLSISLNNTTDVSCNGGNNGSLSTTAGGGSGIYNYSWTTTPAQLSANASNLPFGSYTLYVSDAADPACATNATFSVNEPPALSATANLIADADCNGVANGQTSVTAGGGSGNYVYSWTSSPSQNTAIANNLAAGTYTVYVFDANDLNCVTNSSVVVNEPTLLQITNTSMTPVTCFGGSDGDAGVTVTGGSGNYTYSWTSSPSQNTATATNLNAASYTVYVQDANSSVSCSTSTTIQVTQASQLQIVANVLTHADCFGADNGSADVVANGGSGNYSYSWTTSPAQNTAAANNLTAGTYTVFVEDAATTNCVVSASVTINEPPQLSAVANLVQAVSCNGGNNGAVDVTASGGNNAYTYSWDSNPAQLTASATGLPMGTYTVYVTDAVSTANCSTTATISVTEPAALGITLNNITDVSCAGGTNGSISVTGTGGSNAYLYSWTTAPTQNTATASNLNAAFHTVFVTDSSDLNCFTSGTYLVNEPPALSGVANWIADADCFGAANGQASVTAGGGSGQYAYSWTTMPPQNNAVVTNLAAGTYTVYTYDANDLNCNTSDVVTIAQPAALNVSQNNNTPTTCFGAADGSASVTVLGGSGNYTYSWTTTPVQTSSAATNLAAGAYTVFVQDANAAGNCSASLQLNISQPTQLQIANTNTTDANCFGAANGSANITVNGGSGNYSYSWTTNPPQLTQNATGLANGSYTLYVNDASTVNCSTTTTVNISQPSQLSASTTINANVSCNGGSNGSATVNAAGGLSNYSYSWVTIPAQLSQTATNLQSGTYTVYVFDGPNANNCFTTANATISQPPALSITQNSITDASCNGATNGSVAVSGNGGSGQYTYSWTTTPTQNTGTATGLGAGNYTVYLTDANDPNCQTSQAFTVNEPTALVANASVVNNVSCNGGSDGSATVVANGGSGNYTYSWMTNPIQNTVSASNLSAGTYTVFVYDASTTNCFTTAQVNITQPAGLSIVTQQNIPVSCFGGTNGGVSVSANGGSGNYNYSWNTNPPQLTAAASNLSAGNYTVYVTDATSANCIASLSVSVTQPTALSASASMTNPVSCFGGSNGAATVNANGGSGAYAYSWATTPAQLSAAASGLAMGSYTVYVSDAADPNCQTTASVNISQPTALAGTPNQTDVRCFGQNTGIASIQMSGGATPYTYSWSNSPSTGSSAGQLAAGSHTVYVTDARGCLYTQNYTLTEPAAPISIVTSHTDANCYGSKDGTLTANASGGTSPYTYTWAANPTQIAQTATGVGVGTYTVTVRDANSCVATAQETINQPTRVVVGLVDKSDAYCDLPTGTITVSASGGSGVYAYSWHLNPGVLSATLNGIAGGSYTVTITDDRGCTGTKTFSIGSSSRPVAAFTTTPTNAEPILLTQATIKFNNTSQGKIIGYDWIFGDGNGSNAVNPRHTYQEEGTYTVTLIAIDPNNTCPDTAQQTFVIIPPGDIFTPNVFTPNQDGANDEFYFGGNGIMELQATFYDRWGKLVYEMKSINDRWDGKNMEGKELPEGTYTYKVRVVLNDQRTLYKGGTVMLLK